MIFGSIVSAVGGIATSYLQNKVEQTKAAGEIVITLGFQTY